MKQNKTVEQQKKRLSMKEAFSKISSSRHIIKVGVKEKKSFRDWVWDYPENISNFFRKTSPLSFISIFLIFGVLLFSFFTSNTFANVISSEQSSVFVEGNIGAISSFNPLFTSQNPVDSDIRALVFEKFVYISKDSTVRPGIAKEWSVSEDGKIYEFTLDTTHKWQDGLLVTMDDVMFTFDMSKELSIKLNYDTVGSSLEEVKIEKVSEKKIKFTLPESNATFLEAVSIYIVPKHKFDGVQLADIPFSSFAKYPLGSGPFEVYRSDPSVVYLRASKYYPTKPNIETFIYRLYPDYTTLEAAFRNGILDAMGGVDGSSMSYVSEYPGYTLNEIPLDSRLRMIFFNIRKEKLESKEIRQALNSLIDKEQLLNASEVRGTVSNNPISTSSWAYNEAETTVFGYSPEKASEILTNLGYTKNPTTGYFEKEDKKILSFNLSYYDNELNSRIANSLKDMLKKEGVVLNLEPLSYTQITQEILATRDFELLMFEIETTVDPDQYNLWHSLKSSYPDLNISGYTYERVDILLEDARRSNKIEDRKSKYNLFQRYLTQDAPAIFLYRPNYSYVVKNSVSISDISNIYYPYQRFENVAQWSKDLAL